jgi:hypothetical protein
MLINHFQMNIVICCHSYLIKKLKYLVSEMYFREGEENDQGDGSCFSNVTA